MYRYLCKEAIIPITNSKVAKQLPSIIGNSFKVVIHQNKPGDTSTGIANGSTIIYYNGVTLEEGVKSNQEIDSFARKLTLNDSSAMSKAKILYNYVGKNISYDEDKARKVMANDFEVESGAIPTFNSKKGICFDYACLYAAMCRANGMKVRIITGEGFNGVSWVSHAWNQVYIPESSKWINVDTTFARGGNYFNSKRFEFDHKNTQIAGEW
jgi:transglutaminase/protease-like cytokinesis protein 3